MDLVGSNEASVSDPGWAGPQLCELSRTVRTALCMSVLRRERDDIVKFVSTQIAGGWCNPRWVRLVTRGWAVVERYRAWPLEIRRQEVFVWREAVRGREQNGGKGSTLILQLSKLSTGL